MAGNQLVEKVQVMRTNAINHVTLMSTGIPRTVNSLSEARNRMAIAFAESSESLSVTLYASIPVL